MNIITGALGYDHVTSADDREFNQGLFGSGMYILDVGNKLKASIVGANTINIADGSLVMQGTHAIIEPGSYDSVTIESGAINFKRTDLICVHYEMDPDTGYENISLVVKKGTPASSDPATPIYTSGNIRNGASVAEMPLYKVNIGTNTEIESVECLVKVARSIKNITEFEEWTGEPTSISHGFHLVKILGGSTIGGTKINSAIRGTFTMDGDIGTGMFLNAGVGACFLIGVNKGNWTVNRLI